MDASPVSASAARGVRRTRAFLEPARSHRGVGGRVPGGQADVLGAADQVFAAYPPIRKGKILDWAHLDWAQQPIDLRDELDRVIRWRDRVSRPSKEPSWSQPLCTWPGTRMATGGREFGGNNSHGGRHDRTVSPRLRQRGMQIQPRAGPVQADTPRAAREAPHRQEDLPGPRSGCSRRSSSSPWSSGQSVSSARPSPDRTYRGAMNLSHEVR